MKQEDRDINGTAESTHFRSSGSKSISSAAESYLQLIFELSGEAYGEPRRLGTKEIAEALNVRAASVTAMLQKMAAGDAPLVRYIKHQGVLLTKEGRKAALEIIRNHRLLEMFLYKVMEFPWEEVHREALRLQYAVSPEFTRRMAHMLENPRFDPHGAPIPDERLILPVMSSLRLSQVPVGTTVRIARIPDFNPALLIDLKKLGIVPGSEYTVSDVSDKGETILCTGDTAAKTGRIPVNRQTAEKITIECV